jgi:hypothetical protein
MYLNNLPPMRDEFSETPIIATDSGFNSRDKSDVIKDPLQVTRLATIYSTSGTAM